MKIPTGIENLDKLIGGGFKENSLILLSGHPETGKTLFCLQFLLVERGKKIFVTDNFNKTIQKIKSFKPLLKNISFIEITPSTIDGLIEDIKYIFKLKARRVVFDTMFLFRNFSAREVRLALNMIRSILSDSTIIFSSEVDNELSIHGVEEFVADSVLFLEKQEIKNNISKRLHIWKVKGSEHSNKIHNYDIRNNKIIIPS